MLAMILAQAKFESGGMDWPTAAFLIVLVLAGLGYAYLANRNR